MNEENNDSVIYTNEIYCITSRHGTQFHTLTVSPLWVGFLNPQPHVLSTYLGEHTFVVQTDKPMYLIPYNHQMALKYATKVIDLDTYPSGKAPCDAHRVIKVPMEFTLNVMPYFQFKIDEGGTLYKREGDSKWQKCKLQQ